jgi:magnesium chelatase family protein
LVLVAARNRCSSGYLGDARHTCKCLSPPIERYMGKISGPRLDRIDSHCPELLVREPCAAEVCPMPPDTGR